MDTTYQYDPAMAEQMQNLADLDEYADTCAALEETERYSYDSARQDVADARKKLSAAEDTLAAAALATNAARDRAAAQRKVLNLVRTAGGYMSPDAVRAAYGIEP